MLAAGGGAVSDDQGGDRRDHPSFVGVLAIVRSIAAVAGWQTADGLGLPSGFQLGRLCWLYRLLGICLRGSSSAE